mgnify:CR=1 FL=1
MNITKKLSLGYHKQNKRLWLTGSLLKTAALSAGKGYSAKYSDSTITITPATGEGQTNVVSNTARGAVIDLVNKRVTESFGDYSFVEVIASNGKIVVRGYLAEAKIAQREGDFKRRVKTGEALRKGGAFVGMGLLCQSVARGLNAAGLKTAHRWSNEYSDVAAAVNLSGEIWDTAAPDATMVVDDIYQLDFTKVPTLDVLVMGSPCPAFSSANVGGKKNGNGDVWNKDAGTIFQPILQLVSAANPSIVVLENSKFMVGSIFDHILSEVMERYGYRASETILNGQHSGDFERRERLCRVWVSKGLPELDLENLPRVENERTVADVLEPISLDDPRWARRKYLEAKDAETHNNHQFTKVCLTDNKLPVFTASYAKIQADSPHLAHPERPLETRIFTPSEHCNVRDIDGSLKAALLSLENGTLPEGKSSRGSATLCHRLLGNSCAPRAWEAVGVRLGSWALGLAAEKEIAPAAPLAASGMVASNEPAFDGEHQYAMAI